MKWVKLSNYTRKCTSHLHPIWNSRNLCETAVSTKHWRSNYLVVRCDYLQPGGGYTGVRRTSRIDKIELAKPMAIAGVLCPYFFYPPAQAVAVSGCDADDTSCKQSLPTNRTLLWGGHCRQKPAFCGSVPHSSSGPCHCAAQ